MEWVCALKEALSFIENNLTEVLDVASVADHVHMSPFYLAKGFSILTGYTLGEYIRNRRLYEASVELRQGEDRIIDVAMKYGWETPESFTKAFTRFHGASPSQVRTGSAAAVTFLPVQISIEISGGGKMDFTVSPMWPINLIGFEREFSYEEAYEKIPQFWDEICEKYCNHTIYAGKAPSCPEEQAIIDNCIGEYGVCIDGEGKIKYLVAGKYTGGDVPETMKLVEFPQGTWAKFKCRGPIPEAFQALNTRIFKEWLPGNPDYEIAGDYNIEWYSCDGEKSDADYESGIWVPVKAKEKG